MKAVIWTFVVASESLPNFPLALIRSILNPIAEHIQEPSGGYRFNPHYGLGDSVNVDTLEELAQRLASHQGGGVTVRLAPHQWEFHMRFDPKGFTESRWIKDLKISSNGVCACLTISTNEFWTRGTHQDRTEWDKAFICLAEHLVKATHPLWGIRLHEWDFEYILSTRPDLLAYHKELSRKEVPKLLGPMTYFGQELMWKAPLKKVSGLQIGPYVDDLGCFVSVPEENWEAILETWVQEVEKG